MPQGAYVAVSDIGILSPIDDKVYLALFLELQAAILGVHRNTISTSQHAKTFLAAWYISLPQPHGGGGGLDRSEGESDQLSRYTVSTLSQETMEYSLDR